MPAQVARGRHGDEPGAAQGGAERRAQPGRAESRLRQTLFYPGLEGITFDLQVLFGTAAVAIAAGAFFVRRSWSV
jgi:hypothetical protein